jgi:hypothetical protein
MSVIDIQREHARLKLLVDLAEQPDHRLNSALLRRNLEDRWAIKKPIEWVHDELRWLQDMGAVSLIGSATVFIAQLEQKGLDHVENRVVISGVARPSQRA